MRKTMLLLTVLAFAIAGADPAVAQDPCEPDCMENAAAGGALLAATVPATLAFAALLVRPTTSEERGRT